MLYFVWHEILTVFLYGLGGLHLCLDGFKSSLVIFPSALRRPINSQFIKLDK